MNRLRNIQIYEFSELRVSVWRLNIAARGPTEFYTNRDKNLPKKNLDGRCEEAQRWIGCEV
jgi:hypothetical protein